MRGKIFAAVTLLCLYFFSINVYAEDAKREYQMKTLLMEAETGTVIKQEGGYDRVPQGTMNKLMTVLLAAEEIDFGNLSMDSVLTAGSSIGNQKGAVVWLTPGENITVEETLKAVIIGNANDASLLLAEEIGGTEEEFVGMMNARAFELGMRDTVFRNCAGYDCEGQYSTAYDIALLSRELLKHRFLYPFMNTWTDRVRNGQTEVVNENRLVMSYDGITGLKASHTEESGWCLALAAERGEKRYIAVVLGCGDKDSRFSAGKSLLGDGFAYFKVTTPSFSEEFIRPLAVKGGLDRAVRITAGSLGGLVVPEKNEDMSTVIFMPEYIEAPVEKGQKIGTVGFYSGDTLLCETDLIAVDSVEKITFSSSFEIFLRNLYK